MICYVLKNLLIDIKIVRKQLGTRVSIYMLSDKQFYTYWICDAIFTLNK